MNSPTNNRLKMDATFVVALVSIGLFIGNSEAFGAEDVGHGKTVFQQNCAICHATSNAQSASAGQGPLLAGVVGRRAGSFPNFGYTQALEKSGLTWTRGNLDRFLTRPAALVPGTSMVVSLPSDADRGDVIAYLETLPADRTKSAGNQPATEAPADEAGGSGDWRNDRPGVTHRIDLTQLPAPFASGSAGNGPKTVERPRGAQLSVPTGFTVQIYASDLVAPRLVRVAPNGDVFVAESSEGRIRVLRGEDGATQPLSETVFATGLQGPWGITFYPSHGEPQWVYVGNRNSVVRFPYRSGDLKARGPAEVIVPKLTDGSGGHSTRDIAFSADDQRMFIAVGSGSNVAEEMPKKSPGEIQSWESSRGLGAAWGPEANRANLLVTDPQGHAPLRPFATGIRNPVGLVTNPATGEIWVSTNERDGLGDDLVPDYITHVREGGYYGWPWYYLGNHEDPRHAGERPDLAGKAIVPDLLVQAHSASLEMVFYTATSGASAFPSDYRGDAFAAFHGSWNRSIRTGSKVVRVRMKNGVATGEYEDFLTGFVVNNRSVWGRPAGVAVAHDGALFVTDDSNNTLWRIAYTGSNK